MFKRLSAKPLLRLWVLTLIVLVALVFGAESLFYPFGRDQGIHATIAYAMSNGQIPYLDVYNVKPPLTTFFHWLAQFTFGHSVQAIRLLDLLQATAIALMLHVLAVRELGSRVAGLAGAVIFLLLYYGANYWHTAQTDGWTSLFVVAAVLLMTSYAHRPEPRPRRLAMAGTGVLLGCAVLLKYTVILAVIPLLAWLLANEKARKFFLEDFIAMAAGGCAALGIMLAVLVGTGAFDAFIETQLYILRYTQESSADLYAIAVKPLFSIARSSWVAACLVALGIVFILIDTVRNRRIRPAALLILLWACAGWASGVIQGKGFGYHYLPVLPPVALLAAAGLSGILARISARPSTAADITAGMFILLLAAIFSRQPSALIRAGTLIFDSQARNTYYQSEFEGRDYSWADNQSVADYINQHFPAESTLFIWGYETGVYFLAKKIPVSRFIYTWPLVVSFSDGRYVDQLMSDLQDEQPDIFVVQSGDATPHVTGEKRDSQQMLAEFPTLQSYLYNHFKLDAKVGRFSVYSREK